MPNPFFSFTIQSRWSKNVSLKPLDSALLNLNEVLVTIRKTNMKTITKVSTYEKVSSLQKMKAYKRLTL